MQGLFRIHPWGQFGEMDQSLNAILDASKSPKGCDFCDHPCDHLARSIALFNRGPGINLGSLNGERDFLLIFVYAEHLHFNMLTDVQDFAGMIDAAPGELADMHQSVRASQVNKSPKIGEVADHPMANFARFQLIEQLFTTALAPFLAGQTLR